MLSDSTIGIYFNDNTKIIIGAKSKMFQYFFKQNSSNLEACANYSIDQFPIELNKKVILLQHFHKNLLLNEQYKDRPDNMSMVFIKKWIATEHAQIFRLSNNIVQVNFNDKSELIMCNEGKNVIFIDKFKEKTAHSLINIMKSGNTDLTRRLKYTKEVLKAFIQPSNAETTQQQQEILNSKAAS